MGGGVQLGGANEYTMHSCPKIGALKDLKSVITTMYHEAKENLSEINEHI